MPGISPIAKNIQLWPNWPNACMLDIGLMNAWVPQPFKVLVVHPLDCQLIMGTVQMVVGWVWPWRAMIHSLVGSGIPNYVGSTLKMGLPNNGGLHFDAKHHVCVVLHSPEGSMRFIATRIAQNTSETDSHHSQGHIMHACFVAVITRS